MNCRRAQSEIALWAGDDLGETDRQFLHRHLEACPACREYLEQMQALMQLVEECPLWDEADEASKLAVEHSLWPGLSSRLVSIPSPQHDRFNGWVPAVAVAAVCVAMLLVASPQKAFPPPEASNPSLTSEGDWNQEVDLSEAPPLPSSKRLVRDPIVSLPAANFRTSTLPPLENRRDLRTRKPDEMAPLFMDPPSVFIFTEPSEEDLSPTPQPGRPVWPFPLSREQ